MIRVTRLGGRPLVVNSDLIETIESTPDTILVLTTGKRLVVEDPPDEVVRRIVEFRQRVYNALPAVRDTSV